FGRSLAVRTFDVGHVFWIPILPVGFWKHWRCMNCGNEPHTHAGMRRPFKWVGLIVLMVLSYVSWAAPVSPPDEWIDWFARVVCPAGAALLLLHLLRSRGGVSLYKSLKAVVSANDTTCPFCTTPLLAGPRWSCPGCGVERY